MLAVMRRAAGLCLLLVMSACEEPRSLPTAPTVPTVPNTPVAPTFTLSGVITERFSGRPVQGARVWVWPFTFAQVRSWPPSGMRATPSDGAGRYTISGLPSLGPVWVSTAQTWGDAFSAPYVHQCVTTVMVEGDATLDVTISSTADLVALNASTGPTPPDSRTISGQVFEITSNGPQPGRKRLGGVGSLCNGRQRRRDDNRPGGTLSPLRSLTGANHPVRRTGRPHCGHRLDRCWFGCECGYRDRPEMTGAPRGV